MLQKNERHTVTIEGLSADGHGIGRVGGFTMFIPGALPGETVNILAVKLKKTYGYGKLLDVVTPSAARVEPVCDAFGTCGGCGLQHMRYDAQLAYKTQKVKDTLRRVGGVDCAVADTLGMDEPFRYRNKAQFPVGRSDTGDIMTGFFAPRSHRIVPVGDCALHAPVNRQILSAIENFMHKNKVAPYDEKRHAGLIRHVLTRVGFATGEIMVCVVLNGDNLPHAAELVSDLRQIENMTSILLNVNLRRTNVIMGEHTETLYGPGYITDSIGARVFRISPRSFFQVNTRQTEVLYNTATAFAQFAPNDTVIDAYCGIGSIALYIAARVKKVWGIEIIPEAIEDARINARLNGIINADFVCGDTENELAKLAADTHPDVIILDPPRKGCGARTLSAAAQSAAGRIVYISCDPATLARDVKVLTGYGFAVERVQPVDMFPMTAHVECVVLMTRYDG